MTARSPQRPNAKGKPTPAAPQNQPRNSADLDIEEVLAEYEAQIGALTGQLIQKNLAIRKLKAELVKKRTGSDDGPSEEGPADD